MTATRHGWHWGRFLRNAAVVIITACVIAFVVRQSVIPNLIPKNFGVVREGEIYRAGELTPAALAKVVREHDIRTIVDLGAYDEHSPADRREQATADALGVTRHRYFLYGDGTGDPDSYLKALRVMTDPDAHPVLVHCSAGAQRTGGAVVLYRCIVAGEDFERAYAEASDYRHDPADNPKLRPMLERWIGPIEDAYREGDELDRDDAAPAAGGPEDPAP